MNTKGLPHAQPAKAETLTATVRLDTGQVQEAIREYCKQKFGVELEPLNIRLCNDHDGATGEAEATLTFPLKAQ